MRMATPCALVALLLLAAPASAANKQSWGYLKAGDERLLVYGVPESDIITLSFICQPKQKTVEVVTTVLPRNTKKGRDGTVRLTNGTASLEYAGKTGGDAEHGVHFAAPTPIDAKLFDLLERAPQCASKRSARATASGSAASGSRWRRCGRRVAEAASVSIAACKASPPCPM